ncbi:MAG TPA: nucleotidyltransferase domain-containing protein [Thermoplasmata archaeon]|nr:nucleotidyltransferase domain-containing protein [Thermoplasmata archaeon]
MNHSERIEAACMISAKLLEKHPDEVVATAVAGSAARGEDHEFSDLDIRIIARGGTKIPSHTLVLKSCLVWVDVRSEASWREELEDPTERLPFVIGALETIQPIFDPTGIFKKLRDKARSVPDRTWIEAASRGLQEIIEDLGRARNYYVVDDAENLRVYAPVVAIDLAMIHACLHRMVLISEKELTRVFEKTLGPSSQANMDFRTASRIEYSSDEDVVRSLERLHDFVSHEAAERGCEFKDHGSIRDFEPP